MTPVPNDGLREALERAAHRAHDGLCWGFERPTFEACANPPCVAARAALAEIARLREALERAVDIIEQSRNRVFAQARYDEVIALGRAALEAASPAPAGRGTNA